MSSLLATASLWNDNHSKRRIPTMRKTQKKMPSLETKEVPLEIDNDFIKDRPTTFEEDQETFDDRNSKVTKLIDNMTNVLDANLGYFVIIVFIALPTVMQISNSINFIILMSHQKYLK